ncbi:hypothetical protein Ga0074812_106299 [Parafrankia irregularis]|uniref:Uncharacterized protein n=1 Tax=Parafrankia irregularis TaxID=795642 RepID=A0A0S4QMG0_9ACTN|nr:MULTISPECIES: hypothetical protein [Parafrankia]MBE3202275.1 hypothetical protein [Parafrankia sp. CH37]CUU56044.1 hypothetical protein Ga0074812_106299 [Parafrankia irregularis]
MGDEFTIVVDEATLKRLKGEYQALLTDIDLRMNYYKWTPQSTTAVSLGTAFPLRLGGSGFTEAVGLAQGVELVRQNLVERVNNLYTHATNLRWGLEYLLEEAERTEGENVTTMTAGEFSSYMPGESSTTGAGTTGLGGAGTGTGYTGVGATGVGGTGAGSGGTGGTGSGTTSSTTGA